MCSMLCVLCSMLIGGLQKNTLIDYPGKVAATVFTLGCNFRCPFCYSSELVLPEKIKEQPRISEDSFFDFLKKRKNFLDGIVVCGGEPTIHKDLPEFIRKIKDFGFLVKLDTNGYLPNILGKLLEDNLLDYVAMDVKAPKKKYKKYSGIEADLSKIEKSINLLKKNTNGIDYEFRTTVAPGLDKKDILEVAEWLKKANNYFLQEFSDVKEIINPELKSDSVLEREELEKITKEISSHFKICKVR